MQQETAQITHVSLYGPLSGFIRLQLRAPALASGFRPGQYTLVSTEAEYVRRPLFPIAIEQDHFSVLLPREDPLRRSMPGAELDCIGPLGKGFPLAPYVHNLLLLAQHSGYGVAAKQHCVTFLLPLVEQALVDGKRVLLIHEAPTAAQLFPLSGLRPDVEVRFVTEDGSRGHAGTVWGLVSELAQWADQVYAVGEIQWYGELIRVLEEHRLRVDKGLAWGLIAPEVMPCGMGVCGGCAVDTPRGFQYPCTDGPVFDLTTI